MYISNTQFVHTFNTKNKYSSGYHILQDNREVNKRLCDSFSESYHEEPSEVWRTKTKYYIWQIFTEIIVLTQDVILGRNTNN